MGAEDDDDAAAIAREIQDILLQSPVDLEKLRCAEDGAEGGEPCLQPASQEGLSPAAFRTLSVVLLDAMHGARGAFRGTVCV